MCTEIYDCSDIRSESDAISGRFIRRLYDVKCVSK